MMKLLALTLIEQLKDELETIRNEHTALMAERDRYREAAERWRQLAVASRLIVATEDMQRLDDCEKCAILATQLGASELAELIRIQARRKAE